MTTTFTTMDEARDYVTSILGEYAADHDVDAIADTVTEWSAGKLILKPEYDDEDGASPSFWAVVEDNPTTPNPYHHTIAAAEVTTGDTLFDGSTYGTVTAVDHLDGKTRITIGDRNLTFTLGNLEPLVALLNSQD